MQGLLRGVQKVHRSLAPDQQLAHDLEEGWQEPLRLLLRPLEPLQTDRDSGSWAVHGAQWTMNTGSLYESYLRT